MFSNVERRLSNDDLFRRFWLAYISHRFWYCMRDDPILQCLEPVYVNSIMSKIEARYIP